MNTLSFIITCLGTLVGIIGFIYGISQNEQRKKLENVFRITAQTFPGDIAKIHQSSLWAWQNVKNAFEAAVTLADSAEKKSLLLSLCQATGDTVACERLCHALFNSVLGFQEAQFNTREIIHQEKDTLPLCKKVEKKQSEAV